MDSIRIWTVLNSKIWKLDYIFESMLQFKILRKSVKNSGHSWKRSNSMIGSHNTSLNFIVLSDRFVIIDVSPVKNHVGVSKFSGFVTMMPNLETQKQNEVKSIAQRRKITRKLGRKNTSSLSFFRILFT